VVSFELEAVSIKTDRFGWSQMSAKMKDRLTQDWCEALSPYRYEEIKNACNKILMNNPKHVTNEQQVKRQILKERVHALSLTPIITIEPPRSPPSPEEMERRRVQVAKLTGRAVRGSEPPKQQSQAQTQKNTNMANDAFDALQ